MERKEIEHCKECGTVYGEKCTCQRQQSSAGMPGSDTEFVEADYLEKLWACYQKGIKQEGLSPKDLFIALVADLIKQLKGEK